MPSAITQIRIGNQTIGMIGLEDAFARVAADGLSDAKAVRVALLRRVRRNNYIPNAAADEYAVALGREFRRWRGEEVPLLPEVPVIRVVGPGCARCDELVNRVRAVLAELHLSVELEHVRDLSAIASYGPRPTPLLVIGGQVVSQGRLPSSAALVDLLKEHLPASLDEEDQ